MKTLNIKYTGNSELENFIVFHKIGETKNILLQIFTGVCEKKFIEELIKTIKDLVPHINIIGSTTSGEILESKTFELSTILSFSLFEDTKIITYSTNISDDSYQTAQKLISQFDSTMTPKVAITFTDGLHANGEEYINAFNDYSSSLIVAGGLAGDNASFKNTIVFNQDSVHVDGAVVALLFNENLKVATNASFGWENIGKTMTITKSKQNIVYEIDDKNVIDIYAKYLGDDIAKELPKIGIEFPLIVKKDGLDIPRAVIGKDDNGSLIFAGNLNVGDKVTFGYGNIETILDSGNIIYEDSSIKNSEAIFVYSCMARKALMQESIEAELYPLTAISPVSGFFTYGEFYSECNSSKYELLNQTMTILSLSESKNKESLQKTPKKLDKKLNDKKNLTLKALSHLVSQTSIELEEINNSLETKINLEVEANRKKDKQLLEQSRMAQMGEMISMIAHQWRQPLSAISSTSLGLNLKAKLNKLDREKVIELTANISNYAQHLSSTINDFRDFFKPNKEKQDITYTELVNNVLKIVEVSITNKNINIVKDLSSKEIFSTFPNEIMQVILNLLKNAEDVLVENDVQNPEIRIVTKGSTLIISDNGGGISSNIIGKIFNPYFSTKEKKDGTGLGLYMSKTIIEEHCEGSLSVSNNQDGAEFKIILKDKMEKV